MRPTGSTSWRWNERRPIPFHRNPPMSNANEKRQAGEAAIRYVEDGAIIGVGTGSTVAFFIDALADLKDRIQGAVSSSEQSNAQLKKLGIPVHDLNAAGPLTVRTEAHRIGK